MAEILPIRRKTPSNQSINRVPYTCNFIAIDSIMLCNNCRGNQISNQGC